MRLRPGGGTAQDPLCPPALQPGWEQPAEMLKGGDWGGRHCLSFLPQASRKGELGDTAQRGGGELGAPGWDLPTPLQGPGVMLGVTPHPDPLPIPMPTCGRSS